MSVRKKKCPVLFFHKNKIYKSIFPNLLDRDISKFSFEYIPLLWTNINLSILHKNRKSYEDNEDGILSYKQDRFFNIDELRSSERSDDKLDNVNPDQSSFKEVYNMEKKFDSITDISLVNKFVDTFQFSNEPYVHFIEPDYDDPFIDYDDDDDDDFYDDRSDFLLKFISSNNFKRDVAFDNNSDFYHNSPVYSTLIYQHLQHWCILQEKYIFNLSLPDKLLVLSYTYLGNDFLNKPFYNPNTPFDWEYWFWDFRRETLDTYKTNTIIFLIWISIVKNYIDLKIDGVSSDKFDYNTYTIIENFLKTDNFKTEYLPIMHKSLCDQLNNIILNSPPTLEQMEIYRGEKSIVRRDNNDGVYTFTSFLSTSVSAAVASTYVATEKEFRDSSRNDSIENCCMKVFTVPKGFRMLFLGNASFFPEEQEIVLPLDFKATIFKPCSKPNKNIREDLKALRRDSDNDEQLGELIRYKKEENKYQKNKSSKYYTVFFDIQS